MAITKTTTKSIKDASVEEANINNCAATNTKIGADAVTSAKINNGTVTTDDLASTLDLSSKTLTLPDGTISFDREYNNIGLLGFKMAVNESLTVFNLVDGVVDEFNDESGTDEAEGSNDLYCGTSDYYSNSQPLCYSAGFTTSSVTEPDTSSAGTNSTYGAGTFGSFTVPCGVTSVNIKTWGSSGGFSVETGNSMGAGSGGYAEGTLAVTGGQSLTVVVGEGGTIDTGGGSSYRSTGEGGGAISSCGFSSYGGGGGGLSGVFSGVSTGPNIELSSQATAPQAIVIAGSGGGMGYYASPGNRQGGHGGGLAADGGGTNFGSELAQTNSQGGSGGGGDQEQGGQGAPGGAQSGGLFFGGAGGPDRNSGGGGSGYYGGGGGNHPAPINERAGGGGSSYYGHPQITSGSTEEGSVFESGGDTEPEYPSLPNGNGSSLDVGVGNNSSCNPGFSNGSADGYVLILGSKIVAASTTIVSDTFTSTTVPTSSRIVVFEENIETPTLNTDIIASVSRDGTNFTNATLSDSGYVTGSSGQRILTGQADISGQPSGQSMRWKLQLANNQVKIHGVSLSWA